MKQLLISWAFVSVLACSAMAQSNSFNIPANAPVFFNPAFSGSLDKIRVNLIYRADWVAIPGSIRKYYASTDWMSHALKGGIGIEYKAQTESEGNGQNHQVGLTYAPKIRIGNRWTLSPALKVQGTRNNIFYYDWIRVPRNDYAAYHNALGLSPSILLNTSNFYVGAYFSHLLRIISRELLVVDGPQTMVQAHTNFQAGYRYDPASPWSFSLSALGMLGRDQSSFTLQSMVRRKRVMAGLGFARQNWRFTPYSEYTGTAGMDFDAVRLSVTYAYTLTGLTNGISGGSWELAASFYLNRDKQSSSPEAGPF